MSPKTLARMLVIGVLTVASCGSPTEGIVVSEARIGAPTGPHAALYFTAVNEGEADRLLGAATDVAASAELHETTMGADGTVGMRPVESLELPQDGTLVLEPGGLHVMLLDVDRLEEGDTVPVTLNWERAGEMTVDARVVAPGDTMGHDHG